MKRNIYGFLLILIMGIMGCNSSKTSESKISTSKTDSTASQIDTVGLEKILGEFNIYFKNQQAGLLSPVIQNVPIAYVKSFFKTRDSIFNLINSNPNIDIKYKNINYKEVKSVTIGELLKYCDGDVEGDIIFAYALNGKNLDYSILGKTSNNSQIDIDIPYEETPYIPNQEVLDYYNMGTILKNNRIQGYLSFENKTQFISFSKENTKKWLNLTKTQLNLNDNTPLYIHFGFSGVNGNSHAGVLVSSNQNLEINYPDLPVGVDSVFAFGNKNGTCCPPQY